MRCDTEVSEPCADNPSNTAEYALRLGQQARCWSMPSNQTIADMMSPARQNPDTNAEYVEQAGCGIFSLSVESIIDSKSVIASSGFPLTM